MVAVESDVPLPDDVDAIELDVQANGSTQFQNTYLAHPCDADAASRKHTAGEPVTIRLLAYRGQAVRMLRQTITTVPTARIATLLRI